jgi:glycosyltransferase involved in cell wall biosynthesis
MFGFYISLPFLFFALYRLFIVLYNFYSRPFLLNGSPNDNPLVSILVFVQNSENSIGKLLQSLSNQTYHNYEVLIYNDQSKDKTVDVISQLSAGDKKVRLFNGNDVNNEWQRKNYAYDKLTQLAKGEYYIFIDSDTCIDIQFIANAISHLQRKSLSLLTIYPKQQSQRFLERIQISAFEWLFFSSVSTKSFLKNRVGEILVLNKPLQIFEARTYNSNRWHERCKADESSAIKIIEEINSLNLRNDSLFGDNSLTYNVVSSLSERIDHISGILLRFIKNRNLLIAYSIAISLGFILAVFLLPFPLVLLYLFSIIYGRMIVALLCQQSVVISLIFLPVQFIFIVQALYKAIIKAK